jgi:hypothetical protein
MCSGDVAVKGQEQLQRGSIDISAAHAPRASIHPSRLDHQLYCPACYGLVDFHV